MPLVHEAEQVFDVKIDPSQPMTRTHVVHPLLGCLREIESDLRDTAGRVFGSPEGSLNWVMCNSGQEELVVAYQRSRTDLTALADVMESTAARVAQPVNEWLQARGFEDIHLEQPDPPRTADEDHDLFVASMLDLLVNWKTPGQRQEITSRRTQERYPGVILRQGQLLRSEQHSEWIVQMPATVAKGGEPVSFWFTLAPENPFSLVEQCAELWRTSKEPHDCELDYLHFPMVSLNETINHEWCVGLAANFGLARATIKAAMQQTKFKMNEKGAHLKSAAAMHCEIRITSADLGPERVPVILDKPYLLWITRPGVSQPLLTAYLAEDKWADPQGLEL